MPVFLDTNILLYSISEAPDERAKTSIARKLLDENDCILSIQVLQEFYAQATRSSRIPRLHHGVATELIDAWRRFPIVENTIHVFDAALEITARTGFSFWDSSIVAAARLAGCETLYTEDLSHGRLVDGVRIINPFV